MNSRDRKPLAASSTLSVASDATLQGEVTLESEAGTTLLDTVASSGGTPDSEAGTTLLVQDAPCAAPADDSESKTTLLDPGAPSIAASESETTLLSSKEA